ncbi:hypothetical protein IMX26_14420 [Clostridium sp. 'deep sea']|uniref:hypothetical protein n=1 Tax=Clostridium sp. 'deep sea' TaxID=2779445 RepID=UPI0018967CEC|nr:hypothetical protein [Clostridium sp. 'deep sea']QOR34652.1 hypothetical protein IMX26_14420 [Clostridium sp. 'deep sea']
MKYLLKDNTKIKYFNDMRIVFKSLDGLQNKYNWLITDIECYPEIAQITENSFMSDEELTEILNKTDVQFIWAVFSAFPKDFSLNVKNLKVKPYIRDNYDFWDDVNIQHPQAMVEIDCCDSSYLTLVSRDDNLAKKFKEFFVNVFDLNENKYSNNKRIDWRYPELDKLEQNKQWHEALLYAYNMWVDNKLELMHLIRLGFLSWYLLVYWDNLTINELSKDDVNLILNEVSKFGQTNFNHHNEFLMIFGYMIQQYPLFFGDYQQKQQQGTKMLKKAQFLNPHDDLNKVLYYGTNKQQFTKEYQQSKHKLQTELESRFKGATVLSNYFVSVLKE